MLRSIYVDKAHAQYWNKLEKIAKHDDRASVSYLVNIAVEEYVQKLSKTERGENG